MHNSQCLVATSIRRTLTINLPVLNPLKHLFAEIVKTKPCPHRANANQSFNKVNYNADFILHAYSLPNKENEYAKHGKTQYMYLSAW